jgi:hypothetical protein
LGKPEKLPVHKSPLAKPLPTFLKMFPAISFRSHKFKQTNKHSELQHSSSRRGNDCFFWSLPGTVIPGRSGSKNSWTFRETGFPKGSFRAVEICDNPTDEGISKEGIGDSHDQGACSEGIGKTPHEAPPAQSPEGFLSAQD